AADVDRGDLAHSLRVLLAPAVAAAVDGQRLELAFEALAQVVGEMLRIIGGAARRGQEADDARGCLLHPRLVGVEGLAEAELAAAEQREPAAAGRTGEGDVEVGGVEHPRATTTAALLPADSERLRRGD